MSKEALTVSLSHVDVMSHYIATDTSLRTNPEDGNYVDKGQLWNIDIDGEQVMLYVHTDIDEYDKIIVVPMTNNVGRSMKFNPVVLYKDEGKVIHPDLLFNIDYRVLQERGTCVETLTPGSRNWMSDLVTDSFNGRDHDAICGKNAECMQAYQNIRTSLFNTANIFAYA